MPKKLTLNDAKKSAQQMDGECLSTIYINNNTKMKWKCVNKHIWESSLHSVKDIKYFVRFNYKDELSESFVRERLIKIGVL